MPNSNPKITSPVTTADGTRLFTKDWGQGPALVLTHGWPVNADMWDYHAHFLVDNGFRTISYDKRGFGRSDKPESGYDYDTLAADLAAVIDATGEKTVTLVAYSMAGGEIIRYLSRYGADKVNKIILIGTIVPGLLQSDDNPNGIPGVEFDNIKAGLNQDRATFIAALFRDILYDVENDNTIPVTDAVLRWSENMSHQASFKALLDCVDTFGRGSLRGEMEAVTVPTLVIHGTNDKPVPHTITAQDAAERIANVTLKLYNNASHGIVYTERDRVAEDILAFIRQS